jgi:hypothetical protein
MQVMRHTGLRWAMSLIYATSVVCLAACLPPDGDPAVLTVPDPQESDFLGDASSQACQCPMCRANGEHRCTCGCYSGKACTCRISSGSADPDQPGQPLSPIRPATLSRPLLTPVAYSCAIITSDPPLPFSSVILPVATPPPEI